MRSLYLLDGMALAYRAHFAFIRNPIYTSGGLNTSAIFGFTSTLIDLITHQKPSHLAVVFDTSAPTRRHELHAEYKANREQMPEDLAEILPHLDRMAQAFDIPVFRLDGYEADDIIGTLAHQAEADGFEAIYMVTPDKDFGQLVTEKVKIYRPGYRGDGHEIWGTEVIQEKWGIARVAQVIDMLAICGDKVDNIPGIPGIGPKSAEKLLAQYDTLEGILKHVDELKGKQREKIRDNAEQARLSKTLATIQLDVPIEVLWDDLLLHQPGREKLVPVLAEFEFRTLSKRIFGAEFSIQDAATELILRSEDDPKVAEILTTSGDPQLEAISERGFKKLSDLKTDYRIVRTDAELTELVAALKTAGFFAFDTETTGLNPRSAKLIGLSFSMTPQSGYWVPATEKALAALRPVLADTSLVKIGHNLKFDLSWLIENDCPVAGPCYDTMLAHALINPDRQHGLNTLSEDYLRYSPIRFSELFPTLKKGETIDYSKVETEALAGYAIEDADIALRLWQILEPKLKESGQGRVFYEIETRLLPVLVVLELEGVHICRNTLKNIGQSIESHIVELQNRIYRAAGQEFNLNSPKQLGEVLFERLELVKKPKKTRTGQYATNEQVLSGLRSGHPIVADLLEYRQLSKLQNTYIDALPKAIDPKTGRVHTHYGQVQTSTGRLTSGSPNLQNIPIRNPENLEIRKAFVPSRGRKLLAADYSQIELRILAALSKDEGLLNAFKEKQDIHTATATGIFGIAPEEVTRTHRSTAKMVNFGIPYGITAFGLSQRLGTIGRKEAQELINNYFVRFPGIADYIESQKRMAREKGYVETVCGRRRYLNGIRSGNTTIRSAAERNAINMPIQGTAADMIKIAMIRIQQFIKEMGLKSRMVLQVHDELLFDLHPDEETLLRKMITREMVGALDLPCPIEIEIGVGNNWLEAH